jgi:alkylation response protein AidB-like acyl-CoA dehydrogenase
MPNDLRWPGLTGDQRAIHDTVTDLLAKHSAEADVRRLMLTERGFDDAVWAGLARLGVPALMVPERHGGLGLGPAELALVMHAAGAALLCAPLLSSSVLATALLARVADDAAQAELFPALASGERRAAVAPAETTVRAEPAGGGWTLHGEARFVIDGHTADAVLVIAGHPDGSAVLLAEAGAPGFTATPMRTLDLTRKQAVLRFDGTPARLLAAGPPPWSDVDEALDLARVMLAAEQVGGAEHCLTAAVEYAGQRVQFDRTIGSFQGIKHTCANMLITLEGARAAMLDAVRAAGESPDRLASAASLAKVVCSDGYFGIASDALHVHGGIGFTWEHPSHLYFRRAKSSQLLFGSPAWHLDRLFDLSGIGGAS